MEPLIQLKGITKSFPSGSVLRKGRTHVALDDVDLSLKAGEILGILGESGSGKSTLGRILARLAEPSKGEVNLRGLPAMGAATVSTPFAYRRRVQMVFQDAYASLNPVHRVEHPIKRALILHHGLKGDALEKAASDLFEQVGLRPGAYFLEKFPHELSGGQRQRVAIARALAVKPELVIADEPTSMLDVSIRMDILNLLRSLRDQHQLAVVLITHDLPSAWYITDRIAVLYAGQIVEEGPTRELASKPWHPYTELLLKISSERILTPKKNLDDRLAKDTKTRDGGGCLFAARCSYAEPLCHNTMPLLTEVPESHRRVRCHKPLVASFDVASSHWSQSP
jgi:peptide/nickel transport system ATP-binding protein